MVALHRRLASVAGSLGLFSVSGGGQTPPAAFSPLLDSIAHAPSADRIEGDIDSRVSDVMIAVDDSPDANGNASGMAGTLAAARVSTRAGQVPGHRLHVDMDQLDRRRR